MVGLSLSPSLVLGRYWAFHVLLFLSCLVPLCSWIYSVLFCPQGFANPMSYSIVLGDTDRICLSKNHFRSALLSTNAILCSISGASLPRSTVSLLLSFTLNPASARTSHPIVPSRENGKFTFLGFVGGCFWSWLYWSGSWIYDSWNGLLSSHVQKWSRHIIYFLAST